MIPIEKQARTLWLKYNLPLAKQKHSRLVAVVAIFLARRLKKFRPEFKINQRSLKAAAILHDIDKNAAKLPGEHHPDASVRILREEGMEEIADLARSHTLEAILDPTFAPKSWEGKLLFLADKMVKQEIITVDQRFLMWNEERLPSDQQAILIASYPRVKALEREIFDMIHLQPEEVGKHLTR